VKRLKKKLKILVGIPIHYSAKIPKKLKENLEKLEGSFDIFYARDLKEDAYKGDRIYRIAKARERIRRHALDQGYSHLLFIDSDISFPPETLRVLLSFEGDMITHCYPEKGKRRRIARGLGCTLIKREVLEKCSFLKGILVKGNFGSGREGEDILFRKKVKRAGFKILNIEKKLELRHLSYDFSNFLDQWTKNKRSER